MGTFQNTLHFLSFSFFPLLAIFCQFKNKATNHCNNGLLPTSSAFLCWRLKDNTHILLQKGHNDWEDSLGRCSPTFFLKDKFCFFDDKMFFGQFSTVILTNFAIQGEIFTKIFDITNMKIKSLWITQKKMQLVCNQTRW
jgi:hypothetical protein